MVKKLKLATKSVFGNASITMAYLAVTGILFLLGSDVAIAGSSSNPDSLGGIASNVVDSLGDLTRLITGASYVAGMGFALAGIVKFKAHKDNPTQVPLSAPIVMVIIAAALLFLPAILTTAGGTLFGSSGGEVGSAGGFESFGGGSP